jgi:alcohol dehydrogenase class IV
VFPSFSLGTRIFADVPAQRVLPDELKRLGAKRVLIVSDQGVLKAKLLPAIEEAVGSVCELVGVFAEVMQDPTVDIMNLAGKRCRDEAIDIIVAVGGGACLDAAKGAALVATSGQSIAACVGEDKVTVPPLPVIAIPTTAGTGSEVSWHISVNDIERELKVTVRSPMAVAASAILDPAMIATVPPMVAAAAGMDALTHSLESYVGNVGRWDMTDALGLHACEMIGRSMVPYWNDPTGRHHASQMLMASCFGGIALSHSRTGVVHQMARPLGALFHVPHGLANAVLLPWCLEVTHRSDPARFAKLAAALGESIEGLTELEAAARAVSAVRRMNRAVRIPGSLREFGVTESAIERMAVDALQGKASVTNPCVITKEEVMNIYRQALRGDSDV